MVKMKNGIFPFSCGEMLSALLQVAPHALQHPWVVTMHILVCLKNLVWLFPFLFRNFTQEHVLKQYGRG